MSVFLLVLSATGLRPALAYAEDAKLTASDGAVGDLFGYRVAINGNTAVIGAWRDGDNGTEAGSAYVFGFNGTNWVQEAKLLASDGSKYDNFGYSVAIDGDTALIGAFKVRVPCPEYEICSVGAVYVFRRDDNGTPADPNDDFWLEEDKLLASDSGQLFGFGCSVAIDGDTAVIGSYRDDDDGTRAGSAYVFGFNGASWVEQAKLLASDGGAGHEFGRSVALSGSTAVIGAWWDDYKGRDTGSAYVFERPMGGWGNMTETTKLTASDGAKDDKFGCSVAIDGDTIVIGAYGDEDNGSSAGSAYVFGFNGGSWVQQAKLLASDGTMYDKFGWSVAIDGDTAIIGAFETDDRGPDTGSAYVFRYDGSSWAQDPNKLLASDGGDLDHFGCSVAQSGGAIIIGAYGDRSGSAYVFMDRDGDGLWDSWEINGIDYNGDGTVDLDLPALGANPNHKDLFVEVDAMVGLAPAQATLDEVVGAFANVPNALVNNPDRRDGITLHALLDETNIPDANWPNAWASFDAVKANRFGTPAQRANPNWANIRAAKALAYRYCIFANTHSGTTSSGLAEIVGNDFMVTLGGWPTRGGTADQQAGTFMHELGHTFGLRHGGADNIHHKPNYHSVMNYSWQTPEPLYNGSWQLDYSRAEWPALNESDLDETAGIGGHVGHHVPVGPLPQWLVSENGPVDWNRDGDQADGAAAADINRIRASQASSPGQLLQGHNDWSNLRYKLSGHANFQDGVHSETTIDDEMTFEVYQEIGCTMRGDFDGQCDVDFLDFAIFALAWLTEPADGGWNPDCDISDANDSIINYLDLDVFADNWLTTP